MSAVQDFESGMREHFKDSSRYDVVIEGKRYPPKAIVAIAAKYVGGRVLETHEFSGGKNTKCERILQRAGFEVVPKKTSAGRVQVFKNFREFVDAVVRPLEGQRRIDGRETGGNFSEAGRFRYDGQLWKIHADSDVMPLLRAAQYPGDPFEKDLTKKRTPRLRLRREFRDAYTAQVYIYMVENMPKGAST